MKLTPQEKQIIIDTLLKKYPSTILIYVFGSFATGDATDQSDVDIAFLTPHHIKSDAFSFNELAQGITTNLRREVDLIHLNSASTVFRFVVMETADILYCANETECQRYEMIVYSMYLRFNEERKFILEEFQKRGEIY